ncbi:MAG: hypothetical protein ACFFCF_11285 [Promethearchaeota archaeon]
MPLFRTDRYVKVTVADFKLQKSSENLLAILQKISDLRNVQMAKMRIDREVQGIIKIEEWYEITGAFNVPEGGKSFWVISKSSTEIEPYNFFIRVDRNIEAEDYESAQQKAANWINRSLMKPLERGFSIKNLSISLPEELSQLGRN